MKMNARIYVMEADGGMVKLGHSRNPAVRSKQVGRRVVLAHQTDVLEHVERIEKMAHRVLALQGKHVSGEWFQATVEQAIAAIETAIKQREGIELSLGGTVRYSVPSHTVDLMIPRTIRFTNAMLDEIVAIKESRVMDHPEFGQVVRELLAEAIAARKKGARK